MLLDMFWVFQQKKTIYKENWNSQEIKSVKNVIIKKVFYKSFAIMYKYSIQ